MEKTKKKKSEKIIFNSNKYLMDSKQCLENVFEDDFTSDLKSSLRALIRAKDDSLKMKFQKEMDKSRKIAERYSGGDKKRKRGSSTEYRPSARNTEKVRQVRLQTEVAQSQSTTMTEIPNKGRRKRNTELHVIKSE